MPTNISNMVLLQNVVRIIVPSAFEVFTELLFHTAQVYSSSRECANSIVPILEAGMENYIHEQFLYK